MKNDDDDDDEEDEEQPIHETPESDASLMPHMPEDKPSPKEIPTATRSIGQQMCDVFSPKSHAEAALSSLSSGSPFNGSSKSGSSVEGKPNMTGWSKSKRCRWRRKKNEERAKQWENSQDFCEPRKS